jgi:hypothetical protein
VILHFLLRATPSVLRSRERHPTRHNPVVGIMPYAQHGSRRGRLRQRSCRTIPDLRKPSFRARRRLHEMRTTSSSRSSQPSCPLCVEVPQMAHCDPRRAAWFNQSHAARGVAGFRRAHRRRLSKRRRNSTARPIRTRCRSRPPDGRRRRRRRGPLLHAMPAADRAMHSEICSGHGSSPSLWRPLASASIDLFPRSFYVLLTTIHPAVTDAM